MRSRIIKAGSFRGIFTLKIDRECLRVQLFYVRRKGNFPKIRRYYFRHRSLIVRISPPLLVHQFQSSHLSPARYSYLLSDQAMCLCSFKKPAKYGCFSVLGYTFQG